ncbi:hypothetical protein P7K49_040499, partial [Saguinus oedipus]
ESVYSLFVSWGSAQLARVFPVAVRLRSAVAHFALLVESLCYGRLPQEQQAVSALCGTSVGVGCICSGGCPSPTWLH